MKHGAALYCFVGLLKSKEGRETGTELWGEFRALCISMREYT
jgi:hypothetical protein